MEKYILVLDSGTTHQKAAIVDMDMNIIAFEMARAENIVVPPHTCEMDGEHIFKELVTCAKWIIDVVGGISKISCVGITNQRTTSLAWDAKTGRCITPAVVWRDKRTFDRYKEICVGDIGKELNKRIGRRNPANPAVVLEMLKKQNYGISDGLADGTILFGGIDTYLLYRLTGNNTFATSFSNASITGYYDMLDDCWFDAYRKYLKIDDALLPALTEEAAFCGYTDAELFGKSIPIYALVADQHADLYAHLLFNKGDMKCNISTGMYLNVNAGSTFSTPPKGMASMIGWRINGKTTYFHEAFGGDAGAVVDWLKDKAGILKSYSEMDEVYTDNNNLFFIPSLNGFAAPTWNNNARGLLYGMNLQTERTDIINAALKSLAFTARELIENAENNSSAPTRKITLCGGLTRSNVFCQIFADTMDCTVSKLDVPESTIIGTAMLAGLGCGFWKEEDLLGKSKAVSSLFVAQKDNSKEYNNWKAIKDMLDEKSNNIESA